MTTNLDRAAWAEAAIRAFCTQVRHDKKPDLYDPLDLILSDLLTDMMHLADRETIDFAAVLDRATSHHREEKEEEATA